ncbi:MAG TPA: ribonuclease R [Stellaceae bacterium]|jgi:ribonuclease R|nr:ribonuclease R [Stellaceae bacterium]
MARKPPRNPKAKPPKRSKQRAERPHPRKGERRRDGPRGLPEIGVIEIETIDIDGELHGRPVVGNHPYKEKVTIVPEPGAPALGVGDRALVRFNRGEAGWEARIIRALDTSPDRIVGVYRLTGNGGRIEPTNRKERREFRVARDDSKDARDGEIVLATLKPSSRFGTSEARVIERVGDSSNPRAFSLIAIHSYDIPTDFPLEAVSLAEAAKPVTLGERDDLRMIPLVTIDGADARDFDDAVFAERDPETKDGWHAIVAIADVAFYVRPNDALDREAEKRGNSVYFPDRVVPMLPEALSNELCSLKPNVDRACMAVHLWFDDNGHLHRHRFVRGLMRSAARLTYEEVQRAIDAKPSDHTAPLVEPVLRPLYGAYAALNRAWRQRGALDLDLPERRIQLDDSGKVMRIEPRERLDSHRLIEEFMVAANIAAAETLDRLHKPCLYRVHDAPDPAKIAALSEFLAEIGIPGVKLAKGQVIRPRHFNDILHKIAATPYATLVPQLILRSQAQAIYSPTNIGHFGLALRHYAHFTSPIRRYADLAVHRALIDGLKLGEAGASVSEKDLFSVGEHVSMTERRAAAAERNASDRYISAYLSDRVGAEFSARINGVTRAGLFVTLNETGADGLIPIRSLPSDYYDHDEKLHRLVGRRFGRSFSLGEAVTVQLAEANIVTGSLRFNLVSDDLPQQSKRLVPRAKRRR